MSALDGVCLGISSNPDISGPGVRIALYLQSFLSVLLVRFSPKDAPGAYWAMTSTAFSLIISSIVTSAKKEISLLDAIVVVYVLLLPVLASAFGLSEVMAPPQGKNATRSVHSPLLIIANWTRSVFTYSFALYVWIAAPNFGSDPPECNEATRLIFFGASLPALGSGRILSLAGWGLFTLLFIWRTLKGAGTILIAFQALFSSTASQALLKPKHPPKNEVHRELVTRTDFVTGKVTHVNRLFRPRQIFHELVQGIASQILSWAPSGTDRWYRVYGKTILIGFLAAWAIVMTELELLLNNLEDNVNNEWGFGQILPMLLTISPLFSLYESVLSRRSSGPVDETRVLRFSIRRARGLQRPYCELDPYPPEVIEELLEDDVKKARAPSPFAVVTIDEREMYTTFEWEDTHDPEWDESFDVKVRDLSTVVIRVFDRKCIDQGWPSFIGFVTVLPFSLLPPPTEGIREEDQPASSRTDVLEIPLVRDGKTVSSMTVSISLSTDTRFPPSLPVVPPVLHEEATHLQRRVGMVQFGNKKWGRKKETTTHVYQMS
ncbi:unnamed protein product [Cyclocybe aegerita]|uniref:C2 domain-containing protein n=1 Tax=Cyclocybe aegerita TaxID=1973307 RepID=A0A8S0VUF7_CYCAE|nr:unnamed protein product [Cyclocybe aegerita]